MTNEEAIDVLRLMMNVRMPDESKALQIAIRNLDKVIYKKPMVVDFQPVCPKCGGFLVVGCGCPKNGCGQAIDWSGKHGEG